MKILDRYILTTFVTTFLSVFVILFFIFILQGIWLFIAELAGKDLDTFAIVKFLLFYSPKVVPLVLPLSVLLASIMVFGNFAENYEFAAMKSSGISLSRAMRPLTFFIVGLSIVSFFFANNIIPKAEYEFINLRRNIMQLKPSMAITEGQFSNVGNYNIKVDKKHGPDGRLLDNVTIHGVSKLGSGISVVIKAENGELVSSEDSNFLNLILYNGNYYEDIEPKKYEDRKKVPFAKSSFEKYIINFDLSPIEKNTEDDRINNTSGMLNINELRFTLDSLERNKKEEVTSFSENIHRRLSIVNTTNPIVEVKKDTLVDNLF
ncbi:MAG: LptF/LptG family permease, partial [Flavobacterium sp.]